MVVRKVFVGVAVVAAALAGLVAPTAASAASGPVVCGAGEHLTGVQPGGIDIPADTTCSLANGAADGPVFLHHNASLDTSNATLMDGVTVTFMGQLHLGNTVVHGGVHLDGAFEVNMIDTTVTGSVTGTFEDADFGYADLDASRLTVQGRVDIAGGDGLLLAVEMSDSSIGQGARFTEANVDFNSDHVDRYLTLVAPFAYPVAKPDDYYTLPTEICGTTVNGDLSVHGASFADVRLGTSNTGCAQIAVNGSLILDQNANTPIQVSGTITGDAVCKNDTPRPVPGSTSLHVAGKRIRDCAAFPA
jgi:hypothetical protein